MVLARARPARIELQLSDATFAASYAGGGRTEVPMNGDEIELDFVDWPTEAKVEWDDRRPTLVWNLEDGGEVEDRYELAADNQRLIVTRTFDIGFGGEVEVRFVYDRAPAGRG